MNAFSDLLETMREEGKAYNDITPLIGRVKSGLPDVVIVINGMDLYKDDLYIDKWLYDREDIKCNTNCNECSNQSIIFNPELKNKLNNGDLVLLIPLNNGEKFVITSKVVSL